MANNVSEPAFDAFVALDWADQKHAFALEDAATGERQSGFLDHTPEQVHAWASDLNRLAAVGDFPRPLKDEIDLLLGGIVRLGAFAAGIDDNLAITRNSLDD